MAARAEPGELADVTAPEVGVDVRGGAGDRHLVHVLVELDGALLDRTVRQHGHQQHDARREADDLDQRTVACSWAGPTTTAA